MSSEEQCYVFDIIKNSLYTSYYAYKNSLTSMQGVWKSGILVSISSLQPVWMTPMHDTAVSLKGLLTRWVSFVVTAESLSSSKLQGGGLHSSPFKHPVRSIAPERQSSTFSLSIPPRTSSITCKSLFVLFCPCTMVMSRKHAKKI